MRRLISLFLSVVWTYCIGKCCGFSTGKFLPGSKLPLTSITSQQLSSRGTAKHCYKTLSRLNANAAEDADDQVKKISDNLGKKLNEDGLLGMDNGKPLKGIKDKAGGVVDRLKDFTERTSDYVANFPLWGEYEEEPGLKPVIKKSVSSMVGFVLGDILAQVLSTKVAIINLPRLFRMAALGAFVHGPLGHVFYGILERRLPGSSQKQITKKVLVDQLVYCPLFCFLSFLFTGITAGHSPRYIFAALRHSGPMVVISSWMIWPAAHAVNFEVIPAKQRLLYINVVQVLFNTILSFILNAPVGIY